MDRFTASLRSSVAHGDWYVALTLALTLPDICGKIEEPGLGSQARYARWFENWLSHHYRRRFLGDQHDHVFMSGDDLYALRCSYLHQGDAELAGKAQQVRDALDSFIFVQPPNGSTIHNNQSGRKLQLQVSIFCGQVADAVDAWYAARCADQRIAEAVDRLLHIYGLDRKEIRF
ncbi:hypothetical protein NS337_03350 [Pseudomonas oryzihabitans]|uniref:hypothetical protein n=1 Tax=Pseudomonas oryzihabitans TaxID=47885 RepID=UPI000792FB53|nr:hypothetical protein [Pseudomonas psychrotolerans]KTT56386.1 hypothetical protein NS337_03350 [Pseudomonas psychrotolerans]